MSAKRDKPDLITRRYCLRSIYLQLRQGRFHQGNHSRSPPNTSSGYGFNRSRILAGSEGVETNARLKIRTASPCVDQQFPAQKTKIRPLRYPYTFNLNFKLLAELIELNRQRKTKALLHKSSQFCCDLQQVVAHQTLSRKTISNFALTLHILCL